VGEREAGGARIAAGVPWTSSDASASTRSVFGPTASIPRNPERVALQSLAARASGGGKRSPYGCCAAVDDVFWIDVISFAITSFSALSFLIQRNTATTSLSQSM